MINLRNLFLHIAGTKHVCVKQNSLSCTLSMYGMIFMNKRNCVNTIRDTDIFLIKIYNERTENVPLSHDAYIKIYNY